MNRVLALSSHEPDEVAELVSRLQSLQEQDRIRMLDLAIWSQQNRLHRYSEHATAADAGPAAAAGATVGVAVGSAVGQPIIGGMLGTLIGGAASLVKQRRISPRLISSLTDELDDDEVVLFVLLEERKEPTLVREVADDAERILFDNRTHRI